MNSVNKTLYIPLYGKAMVSRKGILLRDPKAERIWQQEGFQLKGKAASKWLAYNMAMRAAVFDDWTSKKRMEQPDAVVLHIGCGMDSRWERLGGGYGQWYDIDFPEVIRERKKYFRETSVYHMLAADMRTDEWKTQIPAGKKAIIVMEGVSMYFRPEELISLLRGLAAHFESLCLLMDCYSTFGAKASKYKNPINEVGVTTVYGMDDPVLLAQQTGLTYCSEHSLTPLHMIAQLTAPERILFTNLFAGRLARKIYRLHEFYKA